MSGGPPSRESIPQACRPDHAVTSQFVGSLKCSLASGDEKAVTELLRTQIRHVDAIIELNNDDWMKEPSARIPPHVLLGLWTLEYTQELTTPLCITCAHGYTECARYLLHRRADANAAPGGRSPLHEACIGGHGDCVQLLLEYGANANKKSEDGLSPLHYCNTNGSLRCAELLLQHGAIVNQVTEDTQDTPLHVAAQLGLLSHAELYLVRGAMIDLKNQEGETPLSAACRGKGGDEDSYLEICRLLLKRGADPDTQDQQERRPLHHACREGKHKLVELLLAANVDVNATDYSGVLPLSCALQSAELHCDKKPQIIVRSLLNHGARCVCPEAFGKVLRYCSGLPEIIALLYNSYISLQVCSKWKQEISEEVIQTHQYFYTRFFSLSGSIRSLQHLCRFALRRHFGSRCHRLIPLLPIPKPIQDYLLLINEGSLL
ncbi:ankyrin repeat and SOCS box protein 18 isoform X1 [Spea bombifrons]|uniref:ankyrin repeat and SOCS box protein 18 isoform X1 n=1 Tax=Spea bombifrons TaxID=233779 RepID=UPI00234B0FC7|nr:ankyrin repeat and SOCS box protein 18 isoform X1 [Spea bombifrons]